MARPCQTLTQEQVNHFLDRGHVAIHDCFAREVAAEWTRTAFDRLGYDPRDSATWANGRVHMPAQRRAEIKDFAPKAWAAICDLVGGAERIRQPATWGDSFIANFHDGIDRPWEPPTPRAPGWHKDGDFFRHFLDSPEQGLLVIVVWSDIAPQGGGTFVACDSVPLVARFLAQHPEGILPGGFDFRGLVSQCRDFAEITGTAGDVVLLHPYILHASSQNHSGIPRFITNPPIHLLEPMRFDRAHPDRFSLVEQAVLRALRVDRLSFEPVAEREKVVPARVAREQQMLKEEAARRAGQVA